ncbi:GGDEF domain-containing protein [Cryptosporangium japonicum]|uniref:GGDEF domain-containing protein n=1 Tax=Cryptosporangium japonicum TaxID=80872 RepID=UPI0031CF9C58
MAARIEGSVLSRLKTIFLFYAVFSVAVGVVATVGAPYGSRGVRVGVAVGLAGLTVHWLVGWSRDRFPGRVEPLEWVVLAAPGLVVESPAENAGYFGALLFRSYYGTRRQFWCRLVLVQLVPLVRVVGPRPITPGEFVAVVSFGLLVPPMVRFLRGIGERNGRLIARERTQLAGAERLSVAADRPAVYDVAVATAAELTGAPAPDRVLLLTPPWGGRPAEGKAPPGSGPPAEGKAPPGSGPPAEGIPPDLLVRLTGPLVDHLDAADHARLRDAVGLPPAPGGLLLVPITAAGRHLGAFGVSGEPHPPADATSSLVAWGARVAEALRRVDLHAELTFRAYHDPLTTLANRALLESRLEQALGERRSAGQVALLLLDLDGFKQVNDVHGHPAGDELLRAIAARLRGCVRGTDTVARLGGDEFAILLSGVDDPELVATTADRVVAAIREPIDVEGRTVAVGVSVGVAVAEPGATAGVRELIRAGDQAMYRRKATRAGGWERYEAGLRR